jgi:hypothetical protein
MKLGLLFLMGTTSVFGQLSYGVRGGLPLTNFFQAASNPGETFTSTATRFIVGPTVELRLPFGLGLEADALFRHFQYNGSTNAVDELLRSTASNAWEFPLLVKYRTPGVFVKPFLDGGVAFDHWSGLRQITAPVGALTSSSGTSGSNAGFVVGAGIELHLPLIRLSPEIRYTRWGAANVTDLGGALRSNQNQAEFLIGLTF